MKGGFRGAGPPMACSSLSLSLSCGLKFAAAFIPCLFCIHRIKLTGYLTAARQMKRCTGGSCNCGFGARNLPH